MTQESLCKRPIGNHYITLKKDGHIFSYNGRFAAVVLWRVFWRLNEAVLLWIAHATVVGRVVGGGTGSKSNWFWEMVC
jgi:hypothetical protein